MHKVILLLFSGWLMLPTAPKINKDNSEKLQWMTLAEAQAAMQKEKRPLLIDLYTDWCGWCKVMDKKTYTNKNVIAYVQEKFYPVKLNAETRENLQWNNKNYSFNSAYRANELAVYLTYGQLSFPTTVIIPTDGTGPQPVPGYHEPKEFELIVKYFGEGKYGKVPFDQYQREFKPTW